MTKIESECLIEMSPEDHRITLILPSALNTIPMSLNAQELASTSKLMTSASRSVGSSGTYSPYDRQRS